MASSNRELLYKKNIENKFKDLIQPEDYKLTPLTRGAFSKIDNEDFDKIKNINWILDNKGYAVGKNIFLHRLIMGSPINMDINHINHDKLDNRKSNLRICTRHENNINRKPLNIENLTSKYKGVCWDKARLKWRSNVILNGKQRFLGRFECEIEAAKAYDKKAKELFGEFAYLNFNT